MMPIIEDLIQIVSDSSDEIPVAKHFKIETGTGNPDSGENDGNLKFSPWFVTPLVLY